MYLSIIILPLLGSIASGFFGRKIGISGSRIVISMLIPVLIISSLVHFYSIGYMSHDPHSQRFFSYLSLFTFMMIILVTGNNYLLIIAANQSSLSAFLTNRVGDAFLTIGIIVFSLAPYINENIITIIGPTPVSALIHAATMVTAGVYLLIRSSPLIEYSSTVLLILFSSLIGLFQQDIKKIIAYSTMSQLGMMVIAIGLSSYNIAIFHLVNHAFYKGLLFLGAGAVIHAVADNQDLRRYGGLISFLPLTYTVILIASLSLVAFPFMTGFYSKDFILESAFGQYHFSSISVYFIATIGAIFTTLYSVKVIYLTFIANPNGPIQYYKNAHEGDIFLSLPLVILAIFSIYFGYLTKDIFIGLGSGFFIDNSIFIHPMHEILIDTEFAVPTIFKLLPFIFTISFSVLAIIYPEFMPNSVTNFKLSNIGYYIFGFFNQRFLIEYFYNKYIVNTVLDIGGQTTKILDKGRLSLQKVSKTISSLHTGIVTDYALYILLAICFYISIFTFVSIFNDIINIITLSSILVLLGTKYYIKN
ncbi:NADH dehydrogenase subunit 5 [Melampsora americana]|nr:NADH dehydrogenase subunit 5 [Melampsora americana]